MNKFDLTGRKALVTGGARGLGEGMAQALVAAGASVMIGDCSPHRAATRRANLLLVAPRPALCSWP